MEDLNVVDSINGAGTWLVRNQALLLSYAVNIVCGYRYYHHRLDCSARDLQYGKSSDACASY